MVIKTRVSMIKTTAGMYEDLPADAQLIMADAANVHVITINARIINLLIIIFFIYSPPIS